MSEFIYHIHYRPGFKIGKPDGLSRRLGKEKSEMDGHLFNKEQLLDRENNNVRKAEDKEDMKLEGIDVGTWEKGNRR